MLIHHWHLPAAQSRASGAAPAPQASRPQGSANDTPAAIGSGGLTSTSSAVPIQAVCVAYSKASGSGCFLKVTAARPGSTLVFRLNRTTGPNTVPYTTSMTLGANATSGRTFSRLGSAAYQLPTVSGTVEYEGVPASRVALGSVDPDLHFTNIQCHCKGWSVFKKCHVYATFTGALEYPNPMTLAIHNPRVIKDEIQQSYLGTKKGQSFWTLKTVAEPEGGMRSLNLVLEDAGRTMMASARC